MAYPIVHPSEKWEMEKTFNELGTRKPSFSLESLDTQINQEEEATKKGRADGMAKRPMDPEYLKFIQTDNHSIGYKYAEAYKQGRERAYRKTGSNRRKKTKSLRKTRRAKKLNGRK